MCSVNTPFGASGSKAMSQRSRNYSFTLNNYTTEEYDFIEKIKCKYIIYGQEIGEQGTPHIQGFVIFNNAKTFSAAKRSISPRSHIEQCKGTPYDNFVYCSKDGNYVERGDRPEKVGQGNRGDLQDIKKMVAQNITLKKMLADDTIKNYQQLKYAESLTKFYETPRTWKPLVKWFYGPTETGKTRTAFEEAPEDSDKVYVAMDTAQWWDGYDGQEFVIIDDMRKDFMKFHTLLRLLDRYPYRVQTKGSTRQFVAKTIIITCPYPPQQLYEGREDINQLLRRIDDIYSFHYPGKYGYMRQDMTNYFEHKPLEYGDCSTHPDRYSSPEMEAKGIKHINERRKENKEKINELYKKELKELNL